MTSTEIRKKIDKLRTLTTRDARFRPAKWLPLWEIAYQLAVLNEAELVPSVLPPGFFYLKPAPEATKKNDDYPESMGS